MTGNREVRNGRNSAAQVREGNGEGGKETGRGNRTGKSGSMAAGRRHRILSGQMLLYEFRNTIGNPYVHIFGILMPVAMVIIICRAAAAQMDAAAVPYAITAIFLGTGALIPMATVLMGYGISHAQELEKGIIQRMELFGIRPRAILCNRILSEGIFMGIAYGIYFVTGYVVLDVQAPRSMGAVLYILCILAYAAICFGLAHAISTLLQKFGATYCVVMLVYFLFMILGGMMGITYDQLPEAMQFVARQLPVTYICRDFSTVWRGESYNFMPMLQAYLMLGALTGILLIGAMRRTRRKLH